MNSYIQVSIAIQEKEQSDILIALLSEKGYEGFEEQTETIRAFIKEEQFVEGDLLAVTKPMDLSYSIDVIQQQNWNAEWESSFEPVLVNDFVTVRAGFHAPNNKVALEIIITPKMSFGTGHHATTYMMIAQMEAVDFGGCTVLDFGTGTGVLAILAEKMGAEKIIAIDSDDWSIENAKENIAANNCTKISIRKAEEIPIHEQFDIILANINLNVITDAMPAIAKASKPRTKIILSGFLKTDEEEIARSLSHNHLEYANSIKSGEWLCINAIAVVN